MLLLTCYFFWWPLGHFDRTSQRVSGRFSRNTFLFQRLTGNNKKVLNQFISVLHKNQWLYILKLQNQCFYGNVFTICLF